MSSGRCWSACCWARWRSSPGAPSGRSAAATGAERTSAARRAGAPDRAARLILLALVHLRFREAVGTLDALLGAGDVLPLQLLEVGHPRHDVMALGGMADLQALQRPLSLLFVLHQLLHVVPDRVHRGMGAEERDEDELVAELAQLAERQRIGILVPAE